MCYNLWSYHIRKSIIFRENIGYLVYLKECGASATTEASTKVCNLVVHVQVSFLAKHSQCSNELVLWLQLLVLVYRNYTIAECKKALHTFLYANCEHWVRTAESSQVACCASVNAVCDNAAYSKSFCRFDSLLSQEFAYIAVFAQWHRNVVFAHLVFLCLFSYGGHSLHSLYWIFS